MTQRIFSRLAILIAVAGLAGGCANTIRGAGQDTANVVDATQDAGRNIATETQTY
ncbi:entericidin [Chelativorans sp. YIM 93263]